jgi:hypothetical protein
VLVADTVKLIRNNSVPMLQVQLEIIQNARGMESDMCMLGLNDVVYAAPEFTPSEYERRYPRLCVGNEFDEFKAFFEHFQKFHYVNPDRYDTVPERMKYLHKNLISAIDRDSYEPDLRGKALVNLKNVPNGHYTIYYIRIGQPIGINSRLKVLGRAKGVFVNINREKISSCKKPQLDFNHSSSRLSKKETSQLKILKAKSSKRRDNKIIQLDSDTEVSNSDDESKNPEENIRKDFEKYVQPLKEKEELEMEFDGPAARAEPPPLQDAKEYYNNTAKPSDTEK